MQGFFPINHPDLSGHSPTGVVHHGVECGRLFWKWFHALAHWVWRGLWTHI